jgi:hypothetical protein
LFEKALIADLFLAKVPQHAVVRDQELTFSVVKDR